MSVLILEDNKDTLEILKSLVLSVDDSEQIYLAKNTAEAYKVAMEISINVFLIDIILDRKKPSDTSGILFAEKIRAIDKYLFVPIIFVTSLEDPQFYTYRKLHCFSYIEKPFDGEYVREVVGQALKYRTKKEDDNTIFFRKDGIIYPARCREIQYIEVLKRRVYVHFNSGDILQVPYKPLHEILEEANSSKLVQCCRNCIVNRDYIGNIDRSNRYITIKDSNIRLEIGVSFVKKVYRGLGL